MSRPAHCIRLSAISRKRPLGRARYDTAFTDYDNSIEIGATGDSCSCDPHNPLVALFAGVSPRYDKDWEVVHKARQANRWIAPELPAKWS